MEDARSRYGRKEQWSDKMGTVREERSDDETRKERT